MAPKKEEKAVATSKGGDVDNSCELFYRAYRKNCQNMGIEMSAEVKKNIEEEWVENNKPINKVGT